MKDPIVQMYVDEAAASYHAGQMLAAAKTDEERLFWRRAADIIWNRCQELERRLVMHGAEVITLPL
jgi:hypothetical protein